MKYSEIEWPDVLALIGAVLVILFVVGFGVWAIVDVGTQAKCLEAGWASHRTSYNLQRYCVREENEYEITLPLSEVEREN